MIQFKAVSAVLAFIALLAFQVVTPAYFLPPDAEIEMDYQGHLAGHDRPQLFCEPGESRNYALTLSEVRWEVAPGQFFTAWTFNGAIPGPTLCGYEGEALQVEITNRLDRGVEFSVAPAAEGQGLVSSGLLIVNPPWTLASELRTVLPELQKPLGQGGAGRFRLEVAKP